MKHRKALGSVPKATGHESQIGKPVLLRLSDVRPEPIRRLSDQLRQAIKTCGKTRYRIWKETGIAEATLSRFVNGKGGLSMRAVDKIGKCVGLKIAFERRRRKHKGTK